METPNSFGEWLRRRRRALDWTQEELARQAGCATRTIRKIEADELRPSKQLAEILAQCLDIPPKDREDFVRFARGVLRDVIPPMPFVEETAHFAQTGSAAKLIHNLPAQLSSFVGREREIADVKRLLVQSRLVTLTGAGGCGKTRLALQVARDLTGLRAGDLSGPDFPDGVWFVDLAPLSDPVLVPQVIASVFGLHQVSDTPINVLLQNFFRAKNLLLVLDNCEQLIQACAQLCVGLLGACPTLKILATSRETLNIAGETAFRVPSLSIPDLQKPQSINALQQSESIRLFVERARGARSDFQLHDANARAVAQVCQRLDGIPLAIELAAARVNAFSIEEIATHLDNRFCLLTSGSRTALPRYQTLRASVDWSYDLLSDAERVLFRHLGIFVGGFTLDAVEAVCAEENQSEVLDLLSQLVSKSLVISEQRGTSRYRLLETIRDYALAKLGDVGETDLFRARHLDYL
jgi:predicted ATPase/transcriptional regulator with XRE-family HTH domain